MTANVALAPFAPLNLSEFDTPPARILIHDPRRALALDALADHHVEAANFLALPEARVLRAEYARFRTELSRHVDVLCLGEVLAGDPDYLHEARTNPNLMFTRDSSVTLPWAPGLFIPARLALPGRAREAALVGKALRRLGMRPAFAFAQDEYLEGGDVLPLMEDGKRILVVGFGTRTTKAAAIRLALELIPRHVDRIIGLSHDADLLHLDTGFTVLPNRVMLAANDMFDSGFVIDEDRALSAIDPLAEAEALGFTVLRCAKDDAILHERCNMLPLGHGRYVAFAMPAALKAELEARAGIDIVCVEGGEIAKASGGVHCLTRPIYL